MSIQADGSRGTNQTPPGGSADQNPTTDSQENKDMVAYETHRKLLNEKKKRDEELAEVRAMLAKHEQERKDREEAELKAKEDYKKLVELREKELNDEKEIRKSLERKFEIAHKWDAFSKTLQGSIDPKFSSLVDLDEIVIDPTTREIDPMSVTKAVEKFRKEYPEVIRTKGSTGMPQNHPQGNGAALSYDEWLKLPAKEMAKRRSELDLKTLPK